MENEGAGGSGRRRVMGMEESIVVKHAREEVSKGHVGFVGEGDCKIFVAYSLDAGDERKVGNDGGGEVMAEGADVLDEAVRGTGLAEVTELFEVVINGFLGAEGGSEKFGPLEEGVTWSSGGAVVADFSHPPFRGITEEAGGGNGEPVGKGHVVELKRVLKLGGVLDAPDEGGGCGKGTVVEVEGLVDVVVEVVGVEEVGGGVLLEAAVEEGGGAVVTTVMEGMVPSIVGTWSHMDDMLAFMSSREAVTEVRRVLSAWRMAERSGVAVFAGCCSPGRFRAMLSTESVRMSDMLMEDAVMSGEEGVKDAAGTDVEDTAAAVAAAAVAAAAAARWEFLVWRGGMWGWGGQFLFTRIKLYCSIARFELFAINFFVLCMNDVCIRVIARLASSITGEELPSDFYPVAHGNAKPCTSAASGAIRKSLSELLKALRVLLDPAEAESHAQVHPQAAQQDQTKYRAWNQAWAKASAVRSRYQAQEHRSRANPPKETGLGTLSPKSKKVIATRPASAKAPGVAASQRPEPRQQNPISPPPPPPGSPKPTSNFEESKASLNVIPPASPQPAELATSDDAADVPGPDLVPERADVQRQINSSPRRPASASAASSTVRALQKRLEQYKKVGFNALGNPESK
ncbi:hypothetical protein CBR_g17585 [Chara braunii]|uniref:Uncharacterized protein n=1 Tax=Chara braunii TaxID=69332 RepID=A0A388KVA4_CHABU|nr:hypothetical protein CBR_g17585 [Chara braunii]|eukprot:GBG73873.1 hypothetical protein CBR_g17585 [Chara braunii]